MERQTDLKQLSLAEQRELPGEDEREVAGVFSTAPEGSRPSATKVVAVYLDPLDSSLDLVASTARRSALALLTVSWYSLVGSLSATNPAPAWI